MPLSTLLAFVAAASALVLLPGPNTVLIVTRAAAQGRRAGLATAAGVESATVVHIAVAVSEGAELVLRSPAAYLVLTHAGAAHLVLLGVRALRAGPFLPAVGEAAPARWGRAHLDGVLANLLIPKVTLFFLAFLPRFVRPDSADPHALMWLLGMVFLALGALLDIGYACTGGALSRWLRRRPRVLARQHWVVGGLHLALGAPDAAAAPPVGP
ncbi:LysE family translocator [Streptomyces sp. NBC_01214]|uniref:LysE family translocator n=1 Tax=Streptomyces sp. NBC_01214 TaxID=2903777 RepID=UPI0022598E25|nr:LysE family translocator [Streptomyces sp. NBC_01214]MCX4806858.1 LysE family translocator [Streptomyces sp. NBC_01214]